MSHFSGSTKIEILFAAPKDWFWRERTLGYYLQRALYLSSIEAKAVRDWRITHKLLCTRVFSKPTREGLTIEDEIVALYFKLKH